MSKKASSYLKGATILAVAGILSRLLGLFYKVPVYNLVGSYGNGIYSNVTNVYNLLLMVSTVGFPVAISKMISENVAIKDYQSAHNVFRVSFWTLLIMGGLSTVFLFLGADWLIGVANWPGESFPAIMAIAMAPLIIAICSAFRGFFQGFQIMNPTAISQIIEQIIRVGLGVFLCWYFVSNGMGVGMGVGGAVFGATAGGVLAMFFLWFLYWGFTSHNKKLLQRTSRKKPLNGKQIFKRLAIIAIPVTLTSALVSLFSLIDSMIYIPRLALAGIDARTATTMIGDFANADTLINIPLVISGTLAVAMIPAISESFALNDKRAMSHKIDVAIRLVIMVALPCCIGLSVLSQGIFDILFKGSPYGPMILQYYSYATIFMMLSNTFQSILQAIDRFRIPLINLGVAIVIRFVTGWICLAIPAFNIYGIVISSMITFVYLTISNYICVKRYTSFKMNVKQTLLKPLISAVIMGLATWGVYTVVSMFIGNFIGVVAAVIVAGIVYFFIMILIGGITEEELAILPAQKKIEPIYRKIRNIFHH